MNGGLAVWVERWRDGGRDEAAAGDRGGRGRTRPSQNVLVPWPRQALVSPLDKKGVRRAAPSQSRTHPLGPQVLSQSGGAGSGPGNPARTPQSSAGPPTAPPPVGPRSRDTEPTSSGGGPSYKNSVPGRCPATAFHRASPLPARVLLPVPPPRRKPHPGSDHVTQAPPPSHNSDPALP